jgi:hypothetical protein
MNTDQKKPEAPPGTARFRCSYTQVVKLALVLAFAVCCHAQSPAGQSAHLKAVKLVEVSGGRERLVAALPELIESGKAMMQKQCPDCNPAFLTEWGKRMTARIKIDDFVNVAALAYEKHFTDDELTELIAVVSSQKTEKPIALSAGLQKKVSELLPAIMGEITGATTEIGARLGGEVGAEIGKEHPEYFPAKARPDQS